MAEPNNEQNSMEVVSTGDENIISSEEALANMRSAFFEDNQQPEESTEEVEEDDLEEENTEEIDEEEDSDEDDLEEEEESEEDEDEEEVDDSEEEDNEDFDDDDEDLDLDNNPEEDPLDEDDDEEEVETNKETAVTQLRKISKLNKQLESDNDLLNEQLVSKDQEIENLQSQIDKMSAVKVDPTSHPDFMDLRSKTHNGIATQLRRVVGTSKAKAIVGTEAEPRWGKILTEVANLDSLPFEEQDAVEDNLRLHVAQRLGFQGNELDPDIDDEYIASADKIISTVGNFTSNYDKLADLHSTILSKSQNKSLEIGHKEYNMKTKSVREGLALIETMTDKQIQEDPDSLQSLAAKKIQNSPKMKSQFQKIKKAVLEMAHGPEALSQEELDKHVATGKDMDEFHKKRQKRVDNFRNERLAEIASILTLLPEIKEQMPKFFNNQDQKKKNDAKKQVIRKGKTSASKGKKSKVKKPEPTSDELKLEIEKSLGIRR